MRPGITVAIPAHVGRVHNGMLDRAVKSALTQSVPAAAVAVAIDHTREGAGPTRQRALDMVRTEWVAFLDSDDEFLPQHLGTLLDTAHSQGADYVFSWFVRAQGGDPLGHFGKPWNPADPHQTTITTLVRTGIAQSVGFLGEADAPSVGGQRWGEDFTFTLGCQDLGARIVHVPQETWIWHRHSGNSSGRPGQGDAR